MERDSFIFYRSFYQAMQGLNDTQKLQFIEKICAYALDQKEVDSEPLVEGMFALVKPQLQANYLRFMAGVKNGHKGADYGKLGGRPKGVNNPQETLKKPSNVNVNDNLNENDNANEETIILGKPDYTADVHTVIDYLNNKTQQSYRYSESSMRHIRARLAEKFTVADCKKVIDTKTEEWGKDDKMRKYLRPETLFGGKFENYLNQKAEGEEVIDEEQMYWRNKMKEKGHLRIEKGDD